MAGDQGLGRSAIRQPNFVERPSCLLLSSPVQFTGSAVETDYFSATCGGDSVKTAFIAAAFARPIAKEQSYDDQRESLDVGASRSCGDWTANSHPHRSFGCAVNERIVLRAKAANHDMRRAEADFVMTAVGSRRGNLSLTSVIDPARPYPRDAVGNRAGYPPS